MRAHRDKFIFLDVLVHRPELPLASESSPRVGLGLWDSLPIALAVEAAVVALGLALFLPGAGLSRGRALGLTVVVLIVMAFTAVGMTVAPPPSAPAMAASSLAALGVVCALVGRLGRLPGRGPA